MTIMALISFVKVTVWMELTDNGIKLMSVYAARHRKFGVGGLGERFPCGLSKSSRGSKRHRS